jgi:hypothetical protein
MCVSCVSAPTPPPPTCLPANPPVRCNTHGTARHGTSPTFFSSFYIASETSDCLFSLSLSLTPFLFYFGKNSDLPITHDRSWDT